MVSVVIQLLGCTPRSAPVEIRSFHTDFQTIDTTNWIVESETEVSWKDLHGDGFIDIDVPKGITIWFNRKLKREVILEFEVTVVKQDGPNDRVSDLNCFWMATDPKYPEHFFERSAWRRGIFWHYYSLNLYYVGLGGHDNTKTRFRKYGGSVDPLPSVLKEYTNPGNLIVANQRSHIRIVCGSQKTQYWYNGRKLFENAENEPYSEGYFGFRTVNNHMRIHSFAVEQL